jgi:trehalose synthase
MLVPGRPAGRDYSGYRPGNGGIRNPQGSPLQETLLFLPPSSDIEINALQRGSTIVLQKSLKEGFGLTVSEAMWKSKPVIAGAGGGIPLQIAHRYSGILTHSIQGTAHAIRQLINEPDYARTLGIRAKEHIRNNFLITRHLKDYMLLFISVLGKNEDIVYL